MPEPTPAGSGFPRPQQSQTPPMGVSPATGPTPNKGYEQAALQRVGLVIKQLTEILPMAGATSDIGKTILDVLGKLAKHVPAGSNSQASERNALDQMSMKNAQAAQTNKSLMQPAAGAQGGGSPGAAKGGQQMPGMAA
jgi:hypothetical protein